MKLMERKGRELLEIVLSPETPEWIWDWVENFKRCPSCGSEYAVNPQCATRADDGSSLRLLRMRCAGCGLEITLCDPPQRPISNEERVLQQVVKRLGRRRRRSG
jgi:MinD superfamily P-loop ATPase